MDVFVGSHNPVKIKAVRLAFQRVWPRKKWQVSGIKVASGVSDQPMSAEESIIGARQRAQLALTYAEADYGVGIEGGLQLVSGQYFDCGWVVVIDRQGREGVGATIKIIVPPALMDLVLQHQMELGVANDHLFAQSNSKQQQGHFGLMTKNAVTRTSAYRDGVIAALARFIRADVFEPGS